MAGALSLGFSYSDLYNIDAWELTVMLAMELDDAAQSEASRKSRVRGRAATQDDIDALG